MKTRKEQIDYLKNLKDEDIDFSDIPEVTNFTGWEHNSMPDEVTVTILKHVKKDLNYGT